MDSIQDTAITITIGAKSEQQLLKIDAAISDSI
jgi:hypothetical protein